MIINKTHRKAFTMIELIFVIIIMAILAKFGVEFLAQAYNGFINSKINNELQSNSATAVKYVASKLQYRIKPSLIARESNNSFTSLKDYTNGTAPFLEWIGADIEGFRGNSLPFASGVIDLTASSATQLISPATDTSKIDGLIDTLSHGTTGIDDAAIYFVGTNPAMAGNPWGWNGVAITDQNQTIHPIEDNATVVTAFKPSVGTFSGVDAYEFYQLAWTAYTIGIADYNNTTNSGTLTLWYDYQPWKGERYNTHGISREIMRNVSTFQFIAIESLVKIQVCVKSLLLTDEEYSICKEKTVF